MIALFFSSNATAEQTGSNLIQNTIDVCLTPVNDFVAFRQSLLETGWHYPVSAEEQSAYWSMSLGVQVGPKTVVHKEHGFPGVNKSGEAFNVLYASYDQSLSTGVALCSIRFKNKSDFAAGTDRLNQLAAPIQQDSTSSIYDFGNRSAAVRTDAQNNLAPFAIETVAMLPKENEE